MTEFTVHLLITDFKKTWPQEQFRKLFPECIWSQALEETKEEHPIIPVNHPKVTVAVIDILDRVLTKGYGAVPAPLGVGWVDYREVDRYLNLPLFRAMAEPGFYPLWQEHYPKVIEPVTPKIYEEILILSLTAKSLALLVFVWGRNSRDTFKDPQLVELERTALCMENNAPFVEALLQRGHSPCIEPLQAVPGKLAPWLYAAKREAHEALRVMLPKVPAKALIAQVHNIPRNVLTTIITYGKFTPAELLEMVHAVDTNSHGEALAGLLARSDTPREAITHLDLGWCLNDAKLLATFLASPLSQPEDVAILLTGSLRRDYDIMELLLKDKRITHSIVRATMEISYYLKGATETHTRLLRRWCAPKLPPQNKI